MSESRIGSTVLLVTSENSYLLISLKEKLAEKRIRTIHAKADMDSIVTEKEPVSVIVLFIDQEQISDETLIYLRKRAVNEQIPLVLLGNRFNMENVERIFSAEYIDRIFIRPINIEEVAAYVAELVKKKREGIRYRILVVDDSFEMLRKIKEWLGEKYDVTVAKSGAMAIKYLTMEMPDLILLDYEMPVLNGKQVLEMIRSERDFETIPIIFLTACNDRTIVTDIAKLRPEGYLLKTMEPEKIIAEVDSFFARKKEAHL
ncbi:MAG: response regulator [Butyrivibrio sp.]|nr:response regulator [Butyrivibrio sp.]